MSKDSSLLDNMNPVEKYGPYALSFISGLCLMTVAFRMLKNNRLSRYPYTLIIWLSLQESMLFFNFMG